MYPVKNFFEQGVGYRPGLGQPLQTTPYTQAQRQHLTCPVVPDKKLNCAQVSDGGIICEDGTYYPAGCDAPAVTEPALASYEVQNGLSFPQPPQHSLTEQTGEGFPYFALGISLASLVGAIIF